MEPTGTRIRDEIAKLRQLKKQVPSHTAFGDSNTEAIDAQIEVLEEDLDEDEIYARSQNDDDDVEGAWSDRIRDMAIEVRNWLDGQSDEPPSKGWEQLVEAKEEEKRKKK
jgi:hypothetical protein